MLIPFQPAAPFISFLACHEQSIVIKPVALFLDEPVKAFLQFLIIIAISEEFLICCFQDMLLPGDQCSKMCIRDRSSEVAGSGTGTYGLFRDISAPFGVAVFVPMFANGVTANIAKYASGGMEEGAATVKAAISSIQTLTLVELGCIVVGIILVRMLPRIYQKKEA